MSTSKGHRTLKAPYALRLVQEVAQEKWLLKPATRQDYAQRKVEWTRIADKLNAEFNCDYTIDELQRKIDQVKARAHKKHVKRCKADGKKAMQSNVFDLSSDDDTASDVTTSQMDSSSRTEPHNQSEEGDSASTSSSKLSTNTKNKHGSQSPVPMQLHLNDELSCAEKMDHSCVCSNEMVIDDEETSENNANNAEERREVDGSVDAPQQQVTCVEHAGLVHDRERSQLQSAESTNIALEHCYQQASSKPVSETDYSSWMWEFKQKLMKRLSVVPLDRIAEVHQMIRYEIDSLYAEQIAKDVEERFKEGTREVVEDRVLNLLN